MHPADSRADLQRYLERFAEPLAALNQTNTTATAVSAHDTLNAARVQACRSCRFRWVLVVPAFDEPADFVERLVQHLNFADQPKALLVIRVINAPADSSPSQYTRTLATLPPKDIVAPHDLGAGMHMLTIDAASTQLPADQATGLARKIGNDIACRLLFEGHIKTPLLCNSDADAILPGDYFQRLGRELGTKPQPTGAWILPFRHQGATPELHAAGASYELYLRALYLNLAHCGSPYAYPALGSVLAIDPVLYAKSRGFPKRRAGEDFYLLNKLAKLAPITYLDGAPVVLAARASPRVPFGTGPAIQAALERDSTGITSYSLTSFALLKQFYRGFEELQPLHQELQPLYKELQPLRRELQPLHQELQPHSARLPVAWRDPDLAWLLKRLGVPTALNRLRRNHPTAKGLQRALHEWFDALKTVRFLNEARHFSADEPLSAQFAHIARLGGVPSRTGEPDNMPDKISNRAPAFNRELERIRTTSSHSVAHVLKPSG